MGLGLQIREWCCLAGRADVEAAGVGQAGGSAKAEGEGAVPKVCICLPGEVQKKSLKCCVTEMTNGSISVSAARSCKPRVRLGGIWASCHHLLLFRVFKRRRCVWWSRVGSEAGGVRTASCLAFASRPFLGPSLTAVSRVLAAGIAGINWDLQELVMPGLPPSPLKRNHAWDLNSSEESFPENISSVMQHLPKPGLLPEVPRGLCRCACLQPGAVPGPAVRCCGTTQKCLPYRYFEDLQMKEPSEPLGFPFISSS